MTWAKIPTNSHSDLAAVSWTPQNVESLVSLSKKKNMKRRLRWRYLFHPNPSFIVSAVGLHWVLKWRILLLDAHDSHENWCTDGVLDWEYFFLPVFGLFGKNLVHFALSYNLGNLVHLALFPVNLNYFVPVCQICDESKGPVGSLIIIILVLFARVRETLYFAKFSESSRFVRGCFLIWS